MSMNLVVFLIIIGALLAFVVILFVLDATGVISLPEARIKINLKDIIYWIRGVGEESGDDEGSD